MTTTRLMRVEAPHFVAGLEFDRHHRCMLCAPIVKYMFGKTIVTAMNYFKSKGYRIQILTLDDHL